MRILLTNDDGINAAGLRVLAEEFSRVAQVTVAAPAFEQSGTGHGITVHTPLRAHLAVFSGPAEQAWAVQGLPADCVKLAIDCLMPEKPHLVVSGVNHGANLGTDVLYSGTVSGALEGYINGIPALAVSVTDGQSNLQAAAALAARFCLAWEKRAFMPHTMFNINVPPRIAGLKHTSLGERRYENAFDKRVDPMGRTYFWLHGEVRDTGKNGETDVEAVQDGYISITPIQYDLTDHRLLQELRQDAFPLDF